MCSSVPLQADSVYRRVLAQYTASHFFPLVIATKVEVSTRAPDIPVLPSSRDTSPTGTPAGRNDARVLHLPTAQRRRVVDTSSSMNVHSLTEHADHGPRCRQYATALARCSNTSG